MDKEREEKELLKRVREWFDAPEQVRHYQNEFPSGLSYAEERLLQELPTNGKILDLGCGTGRVTFAVARRGFEVVGIDVSLRLIEVAQSVAVGTDFAPHFLPLDDALHLPFEEECFAAILAFKVYCYLPSRASRLAYLEEIFRVLQPEGLFLLTSYVVPAEMFASYADDELHAPTAALFSHLEPGDTFCGGQGFVHWFTEDALHEEFTQSAFQVNMFCSDEDFGGKGFMRLAVLKKRVA